MPRLVFLVVLAVALSTGAARAQSAPQVAVGHALDGHTIFACHFDRVPARAALQALFKAAGVRARIDPAVAGTVTLDVDGASLATALAATTAGSSPPSRFALRGGVYVVTPRPPAPPPATAPAPPVGAGALLLSVEAFSRLPRAVLRVGVRPGEPFQAVSVGDKVTLWVSGTLHPSAGGKYALDLSCAEAGSEGAGTGDSGREHLVLELDKPVRAYAILRSDAMQTVTLTRAAP